ncbi:hypothetical protein [Catelliglobosispora koreensis]|uniref:hypothetical protein n=1 Tax=Catelliglobosispora koreensis TaxID=129052 RepID=UPI00037883EC|nr:hypothetical protein [Catelliglobosispora koreensis]
MSGPSREVVAGHRFDALSQVIDLSVFEICAPADMAKVDDELRCAACDVALCDVEHEDSLSLLVNVAIAHLACCVLR